MTSTTQQYDNCHLLTHPLVAHKLSLLRQPHTDPKLFKELVFELACMLAYEASRQLTTHMVSIQSPMATLKAPILTDKDKTPVIIPILRAGLGMVDGFLALMPTARVGHIGIRRDEKTAEPQSYYYNMPHHCQDSPFFICDPMLATGGTAVEAVNQLKAQGIHRLVFSCIISCPEGIERLHQAHPELPIYTTGIDAKLNDDHYIVPGLGDAGDRLFGTEAP